jgi:hypothetical protein
VFATVEEIAAAENINASYVGRILRLTLLAPDIVEAILDGRQPAGLTLAVLMRPFAVGWREQAEALCWPHQHLPIAGDERFSLVAPAPDATGARHR